MVSESHIADWQNYFKAQKGPVHLVGKADKLVAKSAPLGFTLIAAGLAVTGLFKMYTGTGKLE